MRHASWGLLAVLILSACPSDHDAFTAEQKANAHRAAVEAERFHRESQAEIDRAAAAVEAAERVVAEAQAQAAAEKARTQVAMAQRASRSRSSTTLRRPAPAGPRVAPSGDVWSRLAQCESGMRNDHGAPYYGYFQFSAGTWHSIGMSGLPDQYDYGTQLAAAQRLYARSGAGQWPVCSRKAGLR